MTGFDTVITAQNVCDPATNYFGPATIGIKNGKIGLFKTKIISPIDTQRPINFLNEIVCPGFIDLHVHVYEWVTNFGISPDKAGILSGATTIVDQGSAGPWTVGGFEAFIRNKAITDVRCFVSANLAGALMGGMEGTTLHGPQMTREEEIIKVYDRYPGMICGIKSHGESGGLSHWDTAVLEQAINAGEKRDIPIYVHTGELFPVGGVNRPEPRSVIEKTLKLLRPGDIVAHVYSNMPDGVIGASQTIPDFVKAAYDRGVKFDVGYGINFSYRIAKMMLEGGYPPHTISSDLHGDFNSYHDCSTLDYSLAGAFNRLVSLELPLEEAVKCLTYTPAVLLGSSDKIGTLAEGSIADITILKVSANEHKVMDSEGKEITLSRTYIPSKVFKDGNLFDTDQKMFPDLY
ncbi:MAG: amidohydrolase [Rhodospirillaceae bacterium]|nr:amidohydrolase [Rhodospirillaceae bacterium]|tara:strand:- start:134 stop:1345 length:1212 start_codon:yes stop_codon:yes gene_type:complete